MPEKKGLLRPGNLPETCRSEVFRAQRRKLKVLEWNKREERGKFKSRSIETHVLTLGLASTKRDMTRNKLKVLEWIPQPEKKPKDPRTKRKKNSKLRKLRVKTGEIEIGRGRTIKKLTRLLRENESTWE